jgi:hypothetical protein
MKLVELIEGYNPELWDMDPAKFVWMYKGSPDDLTPDIVRTLPWSRVVGILLHGSNTSRYSTVDMQLALLTNPNHQGQTGMSIISVTDPKDRKRVLTDERLINMQPDKYAEIVKDWFKDNTILMNKWLRYAENIRNMS